MSRDTLDDPMPPRSTTTAPTLDRLPLGHRARIADVTGDDAIAVRLMEMGLTEGEPIEVLGFAPLGDPIEFLVRGYRISLRASEARRVVIADLAGAASCEPQRR